MGSKKLKKLVDGKCEDGRAAPAKPTLLSYIGGRRELQCVGLGESLSRQNPGVKPDDARTILREKKDQKNLSNKKFFQSF